MILLYTALILKEAVICFPADPHFPPPIVLTTYPRFKELAVVSLFFQELLLKPKETFS